MSESLSGNPQGNAVDVSVVIPTRSRPRIVERAVQSALAQISCELEVIVILDGPDSDSFERLQGIPDPRLRVIQLESTMGAAAARNIGVLHARGSWIAFLDDDDEWLPNKLAGQLELQRQSSASWPIVCGAYIGRSNHGDRCFGRRAPKPGEPVSEYMFCRKGLTYGENAIATSVLLVPRGLMLRVPFDAKLKRHQDWDWALRALSTPDTELLYVSDPLSIYSMRDMDTRLSAHADWKYSFQWCLDHKDQLSPKAFSYFVAAECISRARVAKAGFKEIRDLLIAFLEEGRPTPMSVLLALRFLLLPKV